MVDQPASTANVKMPGTPKPWMNRAVAGMLRVPGLRRIMGRTFAVITVTGAKTGKRYTTPVQHMTVDGHYVVLSQKHRVWWRNIGARPDVELLIAGRVVRAEATIAEADDAHRLLAQCLEDNPRVAKFYGVTADEHGAIRADDVAELADRMVVIDIRPGPG